MNIGLLLGSIGLLTIADVNPAPVPAPSFKAGDTWVFDQTEQRGPNGFDQRRFDLTIERTSGDTMLVGIKRDGAPGGYEDHVLGTDWSLRHLVDGREAPTARPFTFPMTLGQTWTVDFADTTRRGAQTSLHVRRAYKVVDWEDVTVPAGTFHAIKVEASGVDEGVVDVPNAVVGGAASSSDGGSTFTHSQRGGTKLVTTRHSDTLYYVPSVKNYVKSVEEQYNSDDVLVKRQTRTLVSYQPGT
jgi:hypothetical protein